MNREYIEGYIYDEFQKDINDILDDMNEFLNDEGLSEDEKDVIFSEAIRDFEKKIKGIKEENR